MSVNKLTVIDLHKRFSKIRQPNETAGSDETTSPSSDRNSIEVLKGISITFEQEKTYAITGISGSGKSTFLHILAGLDTPTAGEVGMHPNTPLAAGSPLGLVFQFPYLISELTVLENVMLKGLIKGHSYAENLAEAENLLHSVGLTDKADALPGTLSGGQQQRVAIARALFSRPAFLLADEPTGSLDQETSRSIIDLLVALHKQWKMGLIISSHDPYVAQHMQEVWEMKNGLLTKKI